MSPRSMLLALLLLAFSTPAVLAGSLATFEIGSGSGLPGASVDIPIQLTHSVAGGLSGYSVAVAHDDTILTLTAVVENTAFAVAGGLTEVDFFNANLAPVGGPGFTLGVVLEFVVSTTVPPGTYGIATASYDISPIAVGGVTPLTVEPDIGMPVVPPVVVDDAAGTIPADSVPGQVTVIGVDPIFFRGDADGNSNLGLADAMTMLQVLFGGGTAPCFNALDFDDDETVNLTDPILLLYFLFAGGASPPEPFNFCGTDPTAGSLDCNLSTCLPVTF